MFLIYNNKNIKILHQTVFMCYNKIKKTMWEVGYMKMRKGFTLIELLIVLAIIAALMAVVTPIALNAVKRARVTQVAENLRNIKSAVESYVYTQQDFDVSDITIDTLENEGYLANLNSDDYEVDADASTTAGVLDVYVWYKGGNVDADDLADVLPGATSMEKLGASTDTDAPGIKFQVEQWW